MRTPWSHLSVAALAAAATYAVFQLSHPRPAPLMPAAEAAVQVAEPPESPARVAAVLEPDDLSPDERINVRLYQQVNRGVVNITTRSVSTDDFFLFNVPREGAGSGSVLDKQGRILTNYHVIDGARRAVITLFDSTTYEAKIVGADPNNDLAVLQIQAPPEKLFPLAWGDSNKLLVGMRVFAIGNPFGLERTLTTGIVSSLNRSLRTDNGRVIRGVIQTDAAINPGNSGGPLLNRRGEMVGITTAIVSRSGQHAGIGLAVPAAAARRVVAELIKYGRVIRPDCGILYVAEMDRGLLITRLAPDGPAERAGLRGPEVVDVRRGGFIYRTLDRSKADLIVAVDGKPVRTADDLLSLVESKKPGDKVALTVMREQKKIDVTVTLDEARE